jgi:isopropylmalate/homocitrate/citramalate synthase
LLKLGNFKWNEIKTIKAIDHESFGRRRYSFISIVLQNGRKFKIESTNFDYSNHELETILNKLGKLTG